MRLIKNTTRNLGTTIPPGRLSTAVATVLVCLGLIAPAYATEEAPKAAPEATSETAPSFCAHRGRMTAVLAYDDGKYFKHVIPMALEATEELAGTLCPGDSVRLALFGSKFQWLGEPITITNADAREQIVKRARKRPAPSSHSSINDVLVKEAFAYWDSLESTNDEIFALYVMTDTMESDAPSRYLGDFDWSALPSFFQGRFLLVVGLLERAAPSGRPLVYVTATPPGMLVEDFPSGGTTSFGDVMRTFEPEAANVEQASKVEVVVVPAEEGWAPTRAHWAVFGGGLVFLLIAAFLLGRRSVSPSKRRRRRKKTKDVEIEAHEVNLVLRDRLSGAVVRQQTRMLEGALRVGSGSQTDFFVPGPYALEIINDGEEGPVLRSANMLGLEIHRSGGRRMTVADGEALKVCSGDRIDIGGGQEVEVQVVS